eukprot:4673125-Amphidinium_carterae.3
MEQPLFDFGLGVYSVDRPRSSAQAVSTSKATASSVQATVTFELKVLTINIRSLSEAGKLKFVVNKLDQMGIDVAFIQETRLSSTLDMTKIGDFHLVSSPASETSGAHGGLMTLVRSTLDATPLFSRQISHGVLVSAVRVAGKCCRFINAHAPIAEAPMHEHDQFALDISLALKQHEPGELVFVGADLNARLMGLDALFDCVGDSAASLCPDDAQHRHSCLRHLSDAQLIALNTVIPHSNPMTWRHNSGSEHQIDFIFAPISLANQGRVTRVTSGDWAAFDCATTSDHCYVTAHIILTVDKHARRRPPPKKAVFVSSAHRDEYAKAARAALPLVSRSGSTWVYASCSHNTRATDQGDCPKA